MDLETETNRTVPITPEPGFFGRIGGGKHRSAKEDECILDNEFKASYVCKEGGRFFNTAKLNEENALKMVDMLEEIINDKPVERKRLEMDGEKELKFYTIERLLSKGKKNEHRGICKFFIMV